MARLGRAVYWVVDERAVWTWQDGAAEPHLVTEELGRATRMSALGDVLLVLDRGGLKSSCEPGDTLCGELGPVPGGTGRLLELRTNERQGPTVHALARDLVDPADFTRAGDVTFVLERGDNEGTPAAILRIVRDRRSKLVTASETNVIDPELGIATDGGFVYWATFQTPEIWKAPVHGGTPVLVQRVPNPPRAFAVFDHRLIVADASRAGSDSRAVKLLMWRLDDTSREPVSATLPGPEVPTFHRGPDGMLLTDSRHLRLMDALATSPRLLVELESRPECPVFVGVTLDETSFFSATSDGCLLIGERSQPGDPKRPSSADSAP